jgi:glycerol-3-phosphate dehydrogenase (NAD(P)+)
VTLLGRSAEEIDDLRSTRTNSRYLPGFPLPESVRFDRLGAPIEPAELTVLAVPSHAVREVCQFLTPQTSTVALAAKGLDASGTRLLSEVVHDLCPSATVGVLSGPNLAVEIAREVPTVAISACADLATAERIRQAFNCRTFRVSISDDVRGVELAGALKNVLAIGAGITDGLGFGDNTKGAFLSRGLMEMARLGVAMGGQMETFLGPAGVGDLFATAVSRLSRNYRLGFALGQGTEVEEALRNLGQVAEGASTSPLAIRLAQHFGIETPVMAAVDAVLGGRMSSSQVVSRLMEPGVRAADFT